MNRLHGVFDISVTRRNGTTVNKIDKFKSIIKNGLPLYINQTRYWNPFDRRSEQIKYLSNFHVDIQSMIETTAQAMNYSQYFTVNVYSKEGYNQVHQEQSLEEYYYFNYSFLICWIVFIFRF